VTELDSTARPTSVDAEGTRSSLWSRVPVQLYASSPSDPRGRRPVDALRAVLYTLLLLLTALLSNIASDIDEGISDVFTSLPGVLEALALTAFWVAVGWAVALLVIAVVRRRPELALLGIVAAALGLLIAVIAAAVVTGESGDLLRQLFDTDGPPTFPSGTLVMTSAVFAVMAPYLTLPFRRLGRTLIAAQMIGSLFLGMAEATGVIASLLIGVLAGALIHLLHGSPAGVPTPSRVRTALHELGVDVDDLGSVVMRRDGVVFYEANDAHGPLTVKVYGRDAWEAELLASIWRNLWYRGGQRSARASRGEYVEHEGFMTYLAASAGVRVPEVVTAGLADNGDALFVIRPDGRPLSVAGLALTEAQTRSLWEDLGRLHERGIIHRRIDLDRVVTRDDGMAGFSDLSSASVLSDAATKTADQAQLLTLTALATTRDDAIVLARTALGDDGLTAVLPYLQTASMPPLVRGALHDRHADLDKIRKQVVDELDVSDVEVAKLRRVTWKSLLNVVLLAVAAYTIIGMLADIDLEAFGRALRDANWWWLAAALVIGQTPRVANAVSTMGSTPASIPLGPTSALHFATCYVNLAVPSSAGRLAITTRYFQRFGIPPAAALSASAIDSLSEFLVQIVLFGIVFFISDVDLGLSLSTDQLSGLATIALIVMVVLVVAGVVVFFVPSLRKKVTVQLHQARDALQVLRSGTKLLELFGGNLLSQLLFAITLSACVRAFGYHEPLSTLILINTAVTLFAGILPVPGGVGVSEAGLSLGLTTAGIPADIAFTIALAYRFCTFYLPPIWGFQSYQWMISKRYL
jgi:uncharacterized membrane protein YbhN (UPF0104 family)